MESPQIRELRSTETSYQAHLARLLTSCEAATAPAPPARADTVVHVSREGARRDGRRRQSIHFDSDGRPVHERERFLSSLGGKGKNKEGKKGVVSPRSDTNLLMLHDIANANASSASSPVQQPRSSFSSAAAAVVVSIPHVRSFSDPGHEDSFAAAQSRSGEMTASMMLMQHLPALITLSLALSRAWEGESTPQGIARGFLSVE